MVERFDDLAAAGPGQIAIGNPKTAPAGRYARAALIDAGLWDVLAQRLVYANNVRQAVEYVARGDASAGLVYRTDAVRFRERVCESDRRCRKAVTRRSSTKPRCWMTDRTVSRPPWYWRCSRATRPGRCSAVHGFRDPP